MRIVAGDYATLEAVFDMVEGEERATVLLDLLGLKNQTITLNGDTALVRNHFHALAVNSGVEVPTDIDNFQVWQKQQGKCPLSLQVGQQFILRLPSNPTTGFRWVLRDGAESVLQSLGPEVYSNPEDAGLVGSAGKSTWRFQTRERGEGRLLLTYQRPWETDVAPAKTFDCELRVK